jgi:Holliday junction resolvasome RuvABC endonuclease subunit
VIVVGLDSAEQTGFAVVVRTDDGRELLDDHGTVTVHSAADVDATMEALALRRPDVVVVEEPFVHPRNPATGLTLARLLGRWLQAAEARGLTTLTVPASMWQPGILPGVTQRTRSAARKQAARAFVRERFGLEVGEDEADAIAMAAYVARTATTGAAGRPRETAGDRRGIVQGAIR